MDLVEESHALRTRVSTLEQEVAILRKTLQMLHVRMMEKEKENVEVAKNSGLVASTKKFLSKFGRDK